MVESLAKSVADKKVETVMSKEVFTVKEDDPLMECVDLMIKNNIRRLPVIDIAGKGRWDDLRKGHLFCNRKSDARGRLLLY